MSSKAENLHRNDTNEKSDIDELEYFIVAENLPMDAVYQILRTKGKSEKDIETLIDKIKDAREHARKVVRKFLAAVNLRYGHLDIPEIIRKGMKHADKYGLSNAQKKVFMNNVMKGDAYNDYTMKAELRHTDMAKFLGFDDVRGFMIKIQPKDHSKLNELHMLYDASKHIHADVKNQLFNYRNCAAEAILGGYEKQKHNAGVHIHPVIAALFIPKIDYFEKRMLYTNIARMVLSRGQAYLNDTTFYMRDNVIPQELDADFELANDIAQDPNSMAHLSDAHPIENIIKRFRAQIELWHNVLNIRQGRYYSTGYDLNDGISGLVRVLNSYEWTFFDSPDLYHVQDEGTILRKLLAVFSSRPTYIQLSDFATRHGIGITNISGLARATYINIPIVNIKLPINLNGSAEPRHTIPLRLALEQTDFFIEHRMIVPKNKSVIYSNSVACFYANRKYPSINYISASSTSMRNVHLPGNMISNTSINNSLILFNPQTTIGRDIFNLRSVVLIQKPYITNIQMITGCTAAIVAPVTNGRTEYYHYNPQMVAYGNTDAGGNVSYSPPITFELDGPDPNDPQTRGMRQDIQERGSIFVYAL